MELYQLRSFAKVAQTGNLTKAAEALHTSQPTVSGHIKALEDECGCQLFCRSAKGMRLTEPGMKLFDQAQEILRAAGKYDNLVHELKTGSWGKVSIGLNTDPTVLKIDQMVEASRKLNPQMEFQFFQSSSSMILEGIAKGQYDGGFIFGESHRMDIATVPLATFPLVVVAARDWAGRMEGRPFEEVARLPWVLPPDDCLYRGILSNELRRSGIIPEVKLIADQERAIKTFVKCGYGISILPAFEVDQLASPGDFYVWDSKRLSIPLSFCAPRTRVEQPPLRDVLGCLEEIWR